MIIFRLIDKILFAALLILMLQIPIIADHYQQYLNGFLDATQSEIDHYQQLADKYGYTDVASMIGALKENNDPLVRDDAQHKQAVLIAHQNAQQAMIALRESNYFEQLWYFVQPGQFERLGRVINLYQPSLPLQPQAIGSALISALTLYLLMWMPITIGRNRRKHRRQIYSS